MLVAAELRGDLLLVDALDAAALGGDEPDPEGRRDYFSGDRISRNPPPVAL